jgi:hypothetical protein
MASGTFTGAACHDILSCHYTVVMTKSTHIQIRCTPEEKSVITLAANKAGWSVSDWLRRVALEKAGEKSAPLPDVAHAPGWTAWPTPPATPSFRPDFKKAK